MKKLLQCIMICMGMLIGGEAIASGFAETYGLSTRAIALGGAFTAVADDFSAAFYNPAGLGQIHSSGIYTEFLLASPRIKVEKLNGEDLVTRLPNGQIRTNPTEASAGKGLDFMAPVLGLCVNFNDYFDIENILELGLVVSMPENNNVLYRINSAPPDQPQMFRYGDDIDHVYLVGSIGAEIIRNLLYFGVGMQAMVYGDGYMYLDNVTIGTGEEDQKVVSQVKLTIKLRWDPIVGFLVTPLERKLKIGFSYREKQELEMDPVPAVLSLSDTSIGLAMVMGMHSFFTPREYSLGCSYDFGKMMVSTEANLQKWGDYRFSPQDRQFFSGTPDFKDTLNLRLGMEYRLDQNTSLLLGYCRQPTPIPDQSGKITNYIDMDKDIFSLGGSYLLHFPAWFKKPVRLAGDLQYQRLKGYTVNKDGVSNGITWVDQESYKVSGNAMAGSASIRLAW